MSAAVRMSNLMSLSYVVFAISVLCFSIVGYLSIFILLTTSFFSVCIFCLCSYSVLFLFLN